MAGIKDSVHIVCVLGELTSDPLMTRCDDSVHLWLYRSWMCFGTYQKSDRSFAGLVTDDVASQPSLVT